MSTLHPFWVIWGDPFRGLDSERVLACDADEALLLGAELRPELHRPSVAILVPVLSLPPSERPKDV